ncbi:MAG: TetR/AcrR family transcriptional regulator [Micrococcales bacterium]|nr:TetR/AcrR family transcriptional regulator [Micrococcales bacterium]
MPRAGLSPQAVLDLALDVVDAGGPTGWADLGLSAVAHRAGVAVPSLYKHVAGLPALRAAVAQRCVVEFTVVLEAAVASAQGTCGSVGASTGSEADPSPRTGPSSSAQALRALADATRAYALAHPGRYRAVQSTEATLLGSQSAAVAELVAQAVARLGTPRDQWVDQVRTVRAAVHGFVELELTGGFGLPDDVDASFRYLVDTLVAGLS